MRSTAISMPVASEARVVAFRWMKSCTGGTYSKVISKANSTMGVSTTQSATRSAVRFL